MDAVLPEVAPLRSASRETVRELGMLDQCLPGITPAESHALIELERHGVLTVQELADILKIDKSSASRVVTRLEDAGLAAVRDEPGDKRRKPRILTTRGRRKLERIHAFANGQVQDALALMTPEEREKVVEGMSLYAKALSRVRQQKAYAIRPIRPEDDPYVAGIIRRVMPEFGADGPGFAIHDPEVAAMSGAYQGKRAGYYVITKQGAVVGGAGFGPLVSGPDDVCELRKMYFLPETRGHGLGRKLLLFVLEQARKAGYARCYLETLAHMTRARELYQSVGFEPLCAPMGSTGHFGCNSWMMRAL